jgi:ubiquinone/menaquinone biosynthesis C-methylase UbiE
MRQEDDSHGTTVNMTNEQLAEAERIEATYARYARSRRRRRAWAADNRGNEAMRSELLHTFLDQAGRALISHGRCLDVGCGAGFWLARLSEAGLAPDRLAGVDVLGGRVQAAKARVPGAVVLQADARSLPFPDEAFDGVLMFTLLSSLAGPSDVERALREADRVLSPGGLLAVYEPRVPNPLNRSTRRVTANDFRSSGIEPRTELGLTVLPLLARRLGTTTSRMYPRLARLRILQTHRLTTYRKPG